MYVRCVYVCVYVCMLCTMYVCRSRPPLCACTFFTHQTHPPATSYQLPVTSKTTTNYRGLHCADVRFLHAVVVLHCADVHFLYAVVVLHAKPIRSGPIWTNFGPAGRSRSFGAGIVVSGTFPAAILPCIVRIHAFPLGIRASICDCTNKLNSNAS